jgi:catechol-2,3-dioxygenase
MPSIAFSHAGIFVSDLTRMESFYTRVLGLTVTDRGKLGNADLVFFSSDPKEHHELVLVSGRPSQLSFNVVNQISFRVDGLSTLRALHRRLQGEPVTEILPAFHGNALSVYFRDLEGNRLELFIDTPWHVDQPVRVPMDFSLPDTELWRWAEECARAQPGFTTRTQWEAQTALKMGGEGAEASPR